MPPPHQIVPMPKRIASLPTVGGMPVPYTTTFVNHDPNLPGDPYYTGTDDTGSLIEKCYCQFGVGRPVFGRPCPTRQRKAMLERRCVTCGRIIGAKSELVFIGVAVHEQHPDVCYSIEPPSHADCAAYAMRVCPTLIEKAHKVTVALCRDYELAQKVAIPGTDPPRHRLAPLGEPVRGIIDLYAAFPDPARAKMLSLAEWMHDHAPRRYRVT